MVSVNDTTVVFLEGLLTLSDIYEKFKIFEIIKPRKPRGNRDDPFGLNIPDEFLLCKYPR